MLIEVEGIDGVGKTTQCELLLKYFQKKGKKALVVKDLDSTEIGKMTRGMLRGSESRSPEVELFLFLACKAQLFSRVIAPARLEDAVVICDRGIGSLVSYFEMHGFPRPFLLENVGRVAKELRPDITFLIDVPIDEAVGRNCNKPVQSKFDLMGSDFFQGQRAIFLDLSKNLSWKVIDGQASVEAIHSAITGFLEQGL